MGKQYSIRAWHIAEKLRLKELRDKLNVPPREFSNYEMVIQLAGEESYVLLYNFGSVVFFNVAEDVVEGYLARLAEFRTPSETMRTSDNFQIEISDSGQNRALFDRIEVRALSYDSIKIAAVLLAQSTALEYYEILIENLLERTNRFSRRLEEQGKFLDESEDLIKFIGQCLNTRQEIISNLYIVDSPDEIWENNELERLFTELKALLDIDVRYRALEHKIQIIQESVEVIVDLSKSKRELRLEIVIVILIAVEVLLYILSIFFKIK